MTVTLATGSLASRIYRAATVREEFHCNYGLNPDYQHLFETAPLKITGKGEAGEARIVELADADFFIATLFLPQMRPKSEGPRPLITAFIAHMMDGG
jgi:CTP synthase (UTP-ammonia lyase)